VLLKNAQFRQFVAADVQNLVETAQFRHLELFEAEVIMAMG
jgi:hypothetical protein